MPDVNVNQKILDKNYNYTMNSWDGFLYDPDTKDLITRCDALSDSAFSIATEMQEKRGGPDNAIIFSIPSNKTVTAQLTNMAFDETWLSLQSGEKLSIGKFTVFGRTASCDVATNSNGRRTIELSEEPVGKYVSIASGSGYIRVAIDTDGVDPKVIDVTEITGQDDKCLSVVYAAVIESKQFDIKGSTPPSVAMLVLKKKIRKGKGGDTVGIITVTLPNFQLDGNLDFSSTLGDSDTMTLNGTAQAAKSTECGGSTQVLGSINIEDIGEDNYKAISISTASSYEIEVGNVDNIQVWASKGSNLVYEPFDVTEDCTYVSSNPDTATVDNTGKITGVDTGSTNVAITYRNLTTVTEVVVI